MLEMTTRARDSTIAQEAVLMLKVTTRTRDRQHYCTGGSANAEVTIELEPHAAILRD